MEVYTPPPYREKRLAGRTPKLSPEARMLVGQKCTNKQWTYRKAAKLMKVSSGAVAKCVKDYKNGTINKKRKELLKNKNSEVENYRHQAELKGLKQEIAELYLENQLLKKILNNSLQVKEYDGSVITTDNYDQLPKDAK